jgi:hypothetical protein
MLLECYCIRNGILQWSTFSTTQWDVILNEKRLFLCEHEIVRIRRCPQLGVPAFTWMATISTSVYLRCSNRTLRLKGIVAPTVVVDLRSSSYICKMTPLLVRFY